MTKSNFERMMEIIDATFETRNDPDQLQVTEQDMEKLQSLHSSTLSEYNEGKGPCVWVLLIPTTTEVMKKFLKGEITESEILKLTNAAVPYTAVYLCSATALPEYRGKGITTRLTLDAIQSIAKEHPVKELFVWPFSAEGRKLAEKIAGKLNLPVQIKS